MGNVTIHRSCDYAVGIGVTQNDDGSFTATDPTSNGGYLLPEKALDAIIEACLRNKQEYQGLDRNEINKQWFAAEAGYDRMISRVKDSKKSATKPDLECFIYLARDTIRGLYKIGKAKNIKVRFAQLKTANAGIELFSSFNGVERDERVLHGFFKDQRVSGEWFSLDYEDIEFVRNYFKNQNTPNP